MAENTDGDDVDLPGSKKDQLLALWVLGVGSEITNKEAGEIVGCSTEHARQVFNAVQEGDQRDELDEVGDDEELLDAVAERAVKAGVLSREEIEEGERESPESGWRSRDDSIEGELEELCVLMDAFQREAEAAGDAQRAYVAGEALRRAEAVLDKVGD